MIVIEINLLLDRLESLLVESRPFMLTSNVLVDRDRCFDIINQTSLRIGDYEDLKKAAFDPYIALRDAYYQNRRSKIEE